MTKHSIVVVAVLLSALIVIIHTLVLGRPSVRITFVSFSWFRWLLGGQCHQCYATSCRPVVLLPNSTQNRKKKQHKHTQIHIYIIALARTNPSVVWFGDISDPINHSQLFTAAFLLFSTNFIISM